MKITTDILKRVTGKDHPQELADAVNSACAFANINTEERQAHFISQLAHESASFSAFEENLNYSAESLMRVWPNRFPNPAVASKYARNPKAIASFVYANRMGNGNESSLEGWIYRGRGAIQLTGKENYSKASKDLGCDFVKDPDSVSKFPWCISTAAWFWKVNNINPLCDKGDVVGVTKKINGGSVGLQHRTELYAKALSALGVRR